MVASDLMVRRITYLWLAILLAMLLASSVTVSGDSDSAAEEDMPVFGAKPMSDEFGGKLESLLPLRSASINNQTDSDPPIDVLMGQVLSSTVMAYNGALSGEWPVIAASQPYTIETRYTYSGRPIEVATQYVGEHLAGLGMAVEYHVWDESDVHDPETYPNVIGELRGQEYPDEIMMIGAHLDSTSRRGWTDAPGADDNASGSTAVLIAADILSQYEWDCTLRFALWIGEEQGKLGSKVYAQRAADGGEKIRGMLNLDMIGWNTAGSEPGIDLYTVPTIDGSMQLALVLSKVIDQYELDLVPEIFPYGRSNSDHASFWEQGYPAILAIEDKRDFNPYYHSANDRLSNLDIEYFTEFVRAAVGTLALMGDCGEYPQIPTILLPVVIGETALEAAP